MAETENRPASLVEKYNKLLKVDASSKRGSKGLEATADRDGPTVELSREGIDDAVELVECNLKDYAKKYFPGHDKGQIITGIRDQVKEGLELLHQKDEEALRRKPDAVAGLEVIVKNDGTRPMYLIQNNKVDLESAISLVRGANNKYWNSAIRNAHDDCGLAEMISSVGVICGGADGSTQFGTGFLVGPSLLLTNKHVWEAINIAHNGRYHEVSVDFQHEYQGPSASLRRTVESMVFVGLGEPRTYGCIDLAVLTLEPDTSFSQIPFQVHAGTWSRAEKGAVFVIGHPQISMRNPYNDGQNTGLRNLEMEFLSDTSGFKRLCPGIVPPRAGDHNPLRHDASTAVGCSGGVVMAVGFHYQQMALGIHFGSPFDNRSNLAHAMTDVLDQVSESHPGAELGTLRQILEDHQANLSLVPYS
jgi:hypothetical protein